MRRLFKVLLVLLTAQALLFSTGCRKYGLRDEPDETQPEPDPRPRLSPNASR